MILHIFGEEIKVNEVEHLMINQGLYGYYKPHDKEIYIDKSLKGYKKDQTLLHEMIHATLDVLGFVNTTLSHDVEEMIAENISKAILKNSQVKWNKQLK